MPEEPSHSNAGRTFPIFLNGREHRCRSGTTVAELLAGLGAGGPGVAVERNGVVLSRDSHAATLLRPGDRVEVVRLVGGG
ncbi:MAG: sulfur carrier protein ThiS [Planctomycetota bacterium]